MKTILEGRAHLSANFEKGTICPCCSQFVKVYKYKLYANSIKALIELSHLGPGFHHISKYAEATKHRPRAAHFADLRHWGFIRKSMEPVDGKKSSGFWEITLEGHKFIYGKTTAKERVRIFNNNLFGFEGEEISVLQALGNKFNYDELMKH